MAGSFLCGILTAAPPAVTLAQAAPQTLPYYHAVVAGNGAQYTPPATLPVGGGSGSTTVHGSATPGDLGPATSAPLNGPNALALDSLGNLYIVDSSGPVRRVDTTGTITTFAGGLNFEGGKNKSPYPCAAALAAATAGTKFVYPIYGDTCPGNEINLSGASGIAIDPATGDVYIAESSGYRIRKISHSSYLTSTVAGTGTKGALNGDLDTCAATPGATCGGTVGTLSGSRGLAIDKHGNLYIADSGNSSVRVANFATGQLTTVVNTAMTAAVNTTTSDTCTTAANLTTAGSAVTGSITDVTFDTTGNLYAADTTCQVVYKIAPNASGVVDATSTISVVLGTGVAGQSQSVFTNSLGTSVNIVPSSVRADLAGNLYVGENAGSHVWFWDAKTGYMHTVFGGSTTPGSCYGQAGSGSAPYNGCDGQDSAETAVAGTPGLALDAWGNLYIGDLKGFYVHELALGTNAPAATSPSGFGNALVHFGAGDGPGTISLAAAPDFNMTLAQPACVSNNSADTTQDCSYSIVNSTPALSTQQYEQAVVTSSMGLRTLVPLTNQAYPTCQPPRAVNQQISYGGATTITLGLTPGSGCSGSEAVAAAPHKYTYTIVAQPTNGTLGAISGNGVTYTPNAGFTGSDSFTYTVTDSSTFSGQTQTYDSGGANSIVLETPTPLTSATATVTLHPYTAPLAMAQSVTVANSTATPVTLAGSDSNNAPLKYTVVTQPANGTLSGTAPALTYTPNGTYFGGDSSTFKVNDGLSDSATATVSLTVNPAAPTATTQSLAVSYQTTTQATLTATGQGTLTFVLKTQPAHGTLGSLSGANVTYTPAMGYSGPDSFTFTVSNAGGSSDGTVNITVSAAPVVPVTQPSSAIVVYNTPTAIMAIAGGGNGQPLTYKVSAVPAHGTLSAFAGATITYTPNSGYSGPDSFQFTATDGANTSSAATISITVTQPPPVANGQSVTAAFQTALPITLSGSGNGTLKYAIVAAPTHGALTGTAPAVTYTPNTNYVGADAFTFKVNNGADSNVATISINVPAPPVPVPTPQTVSLAYQTAKPITLAATGAGTILYAVAAQPAHGTLSGTAPALTYTPNAGYYGTDSFTFTATNPGGPATGTVSLTVAPPPPVAQPLSATAAYGTATPITLLATGGGTLTYSVVAAPAHGAYTLSGAVVTYTPNANYFGADSFTYQASNGSTSNTATVSITVLPAAPVAQNQASVATTFNTPVAVTLVATQAAGAGTVTYQIVASPANGKLSGTAPALTYTPNAGFAGTDTFTFTGSNPGGVSNVATVTIAVNQGFTWAAASGSSISATVSQGQTATYNLTLAGWIGATGPVTLTCTGAAINCSATPNPATLNGTTQVPVTITIATTVPPPSTLGLGAGRFGWFSLLSLGGCLLLLPLRGKRKPLLLSVIAFAAIAALSAGLSGCGSVRQDPFGTAKGTYTFTVTAAAQNAIGTQTVTLTVQ